MEFWLLDVRLVAYEFEQFQKKRLRIQFVSYLIVNLLQLNVAEEVLAIHFDG